MFNELDPVLHSQLRLALMSLLISVKDAGSSTEKTGATAGNLNVQLTKLTETVDEQNLSREISTDDRATRRNSDGRNRWKI